MKISTQLLSLLSFAALASGAAAQDFNIDVGDQVAPYGLPSNAYGAGALRPGQWVPANPAAGGTQTLADITGALTAVTIAHTGGFGAFDSNLSASLTGDDEALMCDSEDGGGTGGSTTWTIGNLAAGNYTLYSYAWAPDNSTFISGVAGGSIDPSQNVGGPWPGSQTMGITFAKHRYTVAAGGSIAVTISTVSGFATVNGFQVVRAANTPTTGYCFGDDSGTLCPCSTGGGGGVPPGTAGNGCPNSLNANGANLAGSGLASISADTYVLTGSGMPNSSVLYFQGTAQTSTMFGDGLRCAGGTVIRLGTKTNVSGSSTYPAAGDLSVSVKGADASGDVRNYQAWYRNSAAFCTASTFNLSNGAQVTWIP